MKNKYIKLYRTKHNEFRQQAVDLIKEVLEEKKSENIRFTTVQNVINKTFKDIDSKHITNSSELEDLYNLFNKHRGDYEPGFDLNAIPFYVKPAFDLIPNPQLTFEEVIGALAERKSYKNVEGDFSNCGDIYKAMYKIGKFDRYQNMEEFDIFNIENNERYDALETEIKNYHTDRNLGDNNIIDKSNFPGNTIFNFNKKYHVALKNEKIFDELVKYYFHPDTTFKEYLEIFFGRPEKINCRINLACYTTTFARLLHEFKESIAFSVDYTRIEENDIFRTYNNDKTLTRVHISNAIKKSNNKDEEIALIIIGKIKKHTTSVKNSYI